MNMPTTDRNFLLVWLTSSNNHRDILTRLEQIVRNPIVCTNLDECVDFLTDNINEKVFLIISTDFARQIIPLIDCLVQVYFIYVFNGNNVEQLLYTNRFGKVRCTSHSIETISELIEKDVRRYDDDSISISVAVPDQCPPSFMYSQILTEILSDIGEHPNAREDLVNFWYQLYSDNESQLTKVYEFDRDYTPASAIERYTRDAFIYSKLNEALRELTIDVIIKMGFFLHDLTQQIKQLYEEQSKDRIPSIVYRGQKMSKDQMKKLCQCSNGLLSFNNFVSTSTDRNVANMYAESCSGDREMTAVLFQIEIDPTVKSAPFALVDQESTHAEEREVLFSMHSIFRITHVHNRKDNLWQVNLKLTSDNDEELIKLTNCIRHEVEGGTGWHRLAYLLARIGKLEKAEEIYQMLLKQTSPNDKKTLSFLFNQLGFIQHQKNNFQQALTFYTKRLNIEESNRPPNLHDLAITYSNIASIHLNRGNYTEALKFYDEALKIERSYLPEDSPQLAITYNNIGMTHKGNGDYRRAIEMYKEALAIGSKSLPSIHPDLLLFSNNIATAYYHLGEYSNAMEFQQKTLEIEQRSLPSDDLHLAATYCSTGLLHKKLDNWDIALHLYRRAQQIHEKSSSQDHLNLSAIYSNMASLHHSKQEYSQALEFYYQTLDIEQRYYGSSHPELAATYRNIAAVFDSQHEHECALQYYEEARKIYEEHLPADHLDFGILYNNMGVNYYYLQDDVQALGYFQRAFQIYRRCLSPNHHLMIDCQENIARLSNSSTSYS